MGREDGVVVCAHVCVYNGEEMKGMGKNRVKGSLEGYKSGVGMARGESKRELGDEGREDSGKAESGRYSSMR